MKRLLIKNIGCLVQAVPDNQGDIREKVAGDLMDKLPVIENAYVLVEGERIIKIGTMPECPTQADEIISLNGAWLMPTWCDPHTHIVFAGSRENEFQDKIKGLSYEEIYERGGGILNSVKRLRETSEAELFNQANARVNEMIGFGTGAIEIKSGYGLSLEAELKMLRVAKMLKQAHPNLIIKSTFLGAHAVPLEYKERKQEYIRLVIEDMLPQVAEQGLADYCDVFCDKGFYTEEETDRILQRATQLGLTPKIHANELDFSGGVQVGVKNKALSVDHLECVGPDEIKALLHSQTMPTLLPSTAFFLGLHYAPARKMIEAGLPIALATDYNPGSSPSGNFPFILSLACIKMKMTPNEAIQASTLNSAYAMGVQKDLGSIAVGKYASFIQLKPLPSLAYLPYAFGSNLIDKVMLKGQYV